MRSLWWKQAVPAGLLVAIVLGPGCSSEDEPEGISSGSSEEVELESLPEATSESSQTEDTASREPATTTTAAPVDLTIEAGFFSEINSIGTRSTSAGAVLTNPNAEAAYSVDVVFSLVDGAGVVVDTTTEHVDYIAPQGRSIVAPLQIGFDLQTEPVRVDVTAIVDEFREDEGFAGVDFSMSEGIVMEVISPAIQRSDFFGQIVGQVRNPSDQVTEFASIDCVVRAAGVIVGGASTALIDPVTPGATIAFEVGADPLSPAADTAECQIVG